MTSKIKPAKQIKKGKLIDELFEEVREDLDEGVRKDAKIKIKTLLQQKLSAEKVLKNITRQIEDLKIKISHDLG